MIEQGADEAVSGMIRAGRNSLLPSRSASACARRRWSSAGGAADQAEAGEADQAEHEQAVGEIAETVAGEQAQRHQSPEGGVAEALRLARSSGLSSSAKAANIAPARI